MHIPNKSLVRWRWYHGVAFYILVQAFSFGLGKTTQWLKGLSNPKANEALLGNREYDAFYNYLKQPRFAPPDWAFPPVWLLNNALCIWGLLHVLNKPKGTPGREAFIRWQGLVWLCYASFSASYFGLRSPINGAIDTNIGLVGTLMSVYVAVFRLKDRSAILSQSTILPWLLLAAAVANAVALWNSDEFYATGPFIEAPPEWVKVLDI